MGLSSAGADAADAVVDVDVPVPAQICSREERDRIIGVAGPQAGIS